ncbi:GNAT family N-acetyltransferase [Stappia stellulata]|uniref:GNAT family N-acetyltransferase n=1 Tax=Stappia stellulata TaxID=71235 RepID=UPI0004222FF4|nr:GNAT family N-acetyltransferase [Stappia stellulata]
MTATTPLRSETFATLQDPRLEALWSDLEARGCATVFQSLAFLRSLEDTVAQDRDGTPLYVAVLDPCVDRALMIVPLTRTKKHGVRRIEFLDHGMADYHFPVICAQAARDASTSRQLRQAFLAALPPHDMLLVAKLIREFRGVPNPLRDGGRTVETRDGASRIDLAPESLKRARGNHSVYAKMAKQRAKLEKRPDFEIVEATTAHEIDSLLSAMADQRLARFSGSGMSDTLQDPAIFAHCRRLAIEGCATGKVLLLGLRVGSDWIATSYCLCHDGVITGTLCSIGDGPFRKHSPGLIATVLEIEWAERNGFALYDFGAGSYDYKDRFGGRHRPIMALGSSQTPIGALAFAAWRARLSLRFWLTERPALHRWLRLRKRAVLDRMGPRGANAPRQDPRQAGVVARQRAP